MKINLSKKQLEIVNHIEGPILVKAGPGSGKTRVLIERIKKLLLIKKRCKILALTFSNLAAEEMKNRLQEDQSIEDYVDNVFVGTIHSFCLDLVQTRGNLIGLESDLVLFENEQDRKTVLSDVLHSNNEWQELLNRQEKQNVFLSECLNLISSQKKKFITPELCELAEPFPQIYEAYHQYLIEQNAIEFDDILYYSYRILTENPSVVNLYTSLYSYICVDEAQDLNFSQYQVVKALCGPKYNNIMLVGDEKQSIYGFNGSDSSLMTESFVKDFSPTIYTLNENFRSAKAIVEYANKIKQSDSVSNYYYNGEISACVLSNETEEATYIIGKVEELIEEGHEDIEDDLTYNDFAIISRNRYVFSEIENTLIEKEIPYYYKKTNAGIENESDFMRAFDLSLRLLQNPKDIIHLRELNKITINNIEEINEYDNGFELLHSLLDNTQYNIILTALSEIVEDEFILSKTLNIIKKHILSASEVDDDEKYIIISDIKQWETHWNKYTANVPREHRSLVSFRNDVSTGKTQDISNDKGVALLTAHMSKGLQYEVVFIAGLAEGTFPDYRAVRAGGREMDQEKNNMYVAVTRAKRLCYLTYPKIRIMPWGDAKMQQKSRFIIDLLDE